MSTKLENKDLTSNDAKPMLCAGAVSKDGISLIHGDSLQALKSYGDNYFDIAINRSNARDSHISDYYVTPSKPILDLFEVIEKYEKEKATQKTKEEAE